MVHRTQCTKFDRTAALASLPKHLLRDEELKTRFVHETTSALDHLNVALISEKDEVKTEWSICVEHVEKRTHRTLDVLGLKYI